MDIVYILGTGSKWDNNEIKYSLRSVAKNLPKRGRVFVVGEKLDWFSDRIIHIPAKDPYEHKLRNTLHKLRIACDDPRISKDFVLMNDDFYILKRLESIKPFYKRTLADSYRVHATQAGYYYHAIRDTMQFLNDPDALDYSLHRPFVYNKAKLKKLLESLKGSRKRLLLRTVYGNRYKIGGKQKNDAKVLKSRTIAKTVFNCDVLSTDDRVIAYPKFRNFIRHRFPTPSLYEKPK